MSRSFLWTLIALLTLGLGFFVWLHYKEVANFDSCHPTHRTVRA